MSFRRFTAALSELRLDLNLRVIRRRECRALARLGAAAAAAGPPESAEHGRLLAQIRRGKLRMEELGAALDASRKADLADFMAASRWMRPVVVLRGLCSRAVLRHQIALCRHSLTEPHQGLGAAVIQSRKAGAELPQDLVRAVTAARSDLQSVIEERSKRLLPYGGSALPKWFPHLRQECTALGRALWLQLTPIVLPRSPALVGLAVGWWIAGTYTGSQFRSVLNSLGMGQGGRRVVSGETYRLMLFWLPILAAALCAYLADRAQAVIQRRYIRPAPDQ